MEFSASLKSAEWAPALPNVWVSCLIIPGWALSPFDFGEIYFNTFLFLSVLVDMSCKFGSLFVEEIGSFSLQRAHILDCSHWLHLWESFNILVSNPVLPVNSHFPCREPTFWVVLIGCISENHLTYQSLILYFLSIGIQDFFFFPDKDSL